MEGLLGRGRLRRRAGRVWHVQRRVRDNSSQPQDSDRWANLAGSIPWLATGETVLSKKLQSWGDMITHSPLCSSAFSAPLRYIFQLFRRLMARLPCPARGEAGVFLEVELEDAVGREIRIGELVENATVLKLARHLAPEMPAAS